MKFEDVKIGMKLQYLKNSKSVGVSEEWVDVTVDRMTRQAEKSLPGGTRTSIVVVWEGDHHRATYLDQSEFGLLRVAPAPPPAADAQTRTAEAWKQMYESSELALKARTKQDPQRDLCGFHCGAYPSIRGRGALRWTS